jgi:inhibitor of cysteine peptidase
MLIVVFFLLSACAPPVTDSGPLPTDTAKPELSDQKSEAGQDETKDDVKDDSKDEVVRGLAPIEDVQIIMLESFPVQVNVSVRGYLPDACTGISEVTQERAGNEYKIEITTVRPKDTACADVIEPFQESIRLDVVGLEAGVYTVDVNGVTQTFELQTDNELPSEGDSDDDTFAGANVGEDDMADMEIGIAPVEVVEVELVSTDPLQAQATVTGYLPDGCTELGEMEQMWEGDTLYVKLTTKRPAGAACITMIQPFEQVIPLDSSGLSTGTFTVQVNEVSASLTVP